MKKYKKIFFDFWDIGIDDVFLCQNCGKKAVDIHHLKFRSQGGKDEINNLIALCRDCHNKAHAKKMFNNTLKTVLKQLLKDK